MFVATALLYPCALAALSLGAGLAADRASGSFLPLCLLATVGAAALIALSQLTTYVSWLAPATPYAMLALAIVGFSLGRGRAAELLRACARRPWLVLASVLAYALALAPVLAAGRPTFSSYMALADSAVHMMGADFLLHHGQSYGHLDLSNSYGQFVRDYYGMSYPSGADTLFGGSAFLLGLPLIWAFQPFNAFMLASAVGPAWLLARRVGLAGGWAALAALTAVVPALVYGYELLASVKEITALSMLLTLGALVVIHRRWLVHKARRGVPFALVLAAGVSALGLAFGAWALAAVIVLALVLAASRPAPRSLALVGVVALALLVAAWPTWRELPSALRIARVIASTSNAGNLRAPLRAIQVLGVWLNGSYKLSPTGAALAATHVLIALTFAAALLGAIHLLRTRAFALAGWLALMLLASFVVSKSVSTWAEAKTLVLTSPVALLLAWSGVAALRSLLSARLLASALAGALAICLSGGVLASDALQYHSSDLAPTARYEELARIGSRYASKGPTLFTDFDEYSLYELRELDIGGPDFVYPPPALAAAAGGYGEPVDLDRVPPRALRPYRLIVTRRDPAASRPPAAYRLLWQGSYYQVWGRRARAAPAIAHVPLSGSPASQCQSIGALARSASEEQEQLIAAPAPALVRVALARSSHPRRWGHEREGLVMSTPGRLSASFAVPTQGAWELWVQGQIMPAVQVSVDGRSVSSIAGQLDGNSLVPNTVPPIALSLSAGEHRLTVTRSGFSLAPGQAGQAVLDAIFLTPAAADPQGPLSEVPPADWPSLCGRGYQWVELVPPSAGERRL
jgi:hypothetical protein